MGFADLHIHSIHSHDGTCTIPAILKHVADNTNLDVIAITDHDMICGIQEAMELAPAYGIEVIPGCEVSTAEGHLLALFIDRPIMAGLSLIHTVLRVGAAGGLCVAAHPMARGTSSLKFEAIRHAIQNPDVARVFVGVEAYNGGLVYTRSNPIVETICQTLPMAQLGNSDSHFLQTIGQGSSFFQGKTASDVRTALVTGTTQVQKAAGLNGLAVLRSYLPRYILRKLGWVEWNESPQAPLKYVRFSPFMLGNRL
jgi:predicted metal-dependent phosphoesterase TrpH